MISAGVPLGEFTFGGKYKILPKKMRITSFIFSCVFVFIGLACLNYGGIINIGLGHLPAKIIIIIQTFFLAYAVYGNGVIAKSKKEKYVMTPVSAATLISSIIVLAAV